MMSLTIKHLYKSYGALPVLKDFGFSVSEGELVAFVGPSGCGKSTLLNIISGIDGPDSGVIEMPKTDSRIGYMMQEPHLLPWRTLSENALLGVEVTNRVKGNEYFLRQHMRAFGLDSHSDSYPDESSGGMKQRAALIRTLLIRPRILLLDEPFGSLDFDIKLKVQRKVVEYHRKTKAITLLVTHDIEDAIALANLVVVFSEKPSIVKVKVRIDLGGYGGDPVEARKSSKFRDYFAQIWDELRYLDGHYEN